MLVPHFDPSAEKLSLSAGTANLPPETSVPTSSARSGNFNRGRLSVNSAWFRTTKENARESDPTNSLLYVLAGTQRVSGTRLMSDGRVTSRWDILASYAYLDSKVVGSSFIRSPLVIRWPTCRRTASISGATIALRTTSNSAAAQTTSRAVPRVPLSAGSGYRLG